MKRFIQFVFVLFFSTCWLNISADDAVIPDGIFADDLCTKLADGVNATTIAALNDGVFKTLATSLLNSTYDASNRCRSYRPYANRNTVTTLMGTSGGTSSRENPTGIYFKAGNAVVIVKNTNGKFVSLTVWDSDADKYEKTYPLKEGVNLLSITYNGLGYINYYTDDYDYSQPSALPKLEINIPSGDVNGIFERGMSATQWKSILSNAPFHHIDMLGRLAQMVFPTDALKQYCASDGGDLIQIYDSIVAIQVEMLGLAKYNRMPQGHFLFESSTTESGWYASGCTAHFGGGADQVCSPSAMHNNLWGVAHEMGHVNTNQSMKIVSTTEVINNIFSVWIQYALGKVEPAHLEQEVKNDVYYTGDLNGNGCYGIDMAGGRFNSYLNNEILSKTQWLCALGADAMGQPWSQWKYGNTDHFVKLCPLWQLSLYSRVIKPEKYDFWPDLNELCRTHSYSNEGQKMTNMLKFMCDAMGEDLTDFFRTSGMLRTYDKYMLDYGNASLNISAQDSADVVSYASKYAKPESPVLYYICANNIDAFKNKAAVQGTFGQGVTTSVTNTKAYLRFITVNHSVWKNVVAFETYSSSRLLHISMVGSGYTDNSKTRVYYPAGAQAVYAIGWDGSRTLVYGSAVAFDSFITPDETLSPTLLADGDTIMMVTKHQTTTDDGYLIENRKLTTTPSSKCYYVVENTGATGSITGRPTFYLRQAASGYYLNGSSFSTKDEARAWQFNTVAEMKNYHSADGTQVGGTSSTLADSADVIIASGRADSLAYLTTARGYAFLNVANSNNTWYLPNVIYQEIRTLVNNCWDLINKNPGSFENNKALMPALTNADEALVTEKTNQELHTIYNTLNVQYLKILRVQLQALVTKYAGQIGDNPGQYPSTGAFGKAVLTAKSVLGKGLTGDSLTLAYNDLTAAYVNLTSSDVNPVVAGYYRLRNAKTSQYPNTYLSVPASETSMPRYVKNVTNTDNTNYVFQIEASGSYFTIKSVTNGKYLSNAQGSDYIVKLSNAKSTFAIVSLGSCQFAVRTTAATSRTALFPDQWSGSEIAYWTDGDVDDGGAWYFEKAPDYTGISPVINDVQTQNHLTYDLQGRSVVNLQKGQFYIRNGKVFIAK